jgi:hypothetical protein
MLETLDMPKKQDVKNSIIETLFKHNGSIKEFASGEEIVTEIADMFSLSKEQREAVLERIYRKEDRIVKTPLWHRLLYRAADELAKEKLVTRPTDTILLTNKKEWLLTEKGIDYAIKLLHISSIQKESLPTNSFEIQEEVKKIKETPRPEKYTPFETINKPKVATRIASLRSRGFRHAIIETYNYTCCVCGLKIHSPNTLYWEIEAAHIVPHGLNGKDDVWNGIALCRLHHWAFDVGWFTLSNDFQLIVSGQLERLSDTFGKMAGYDIMKNTLVPHKTIILPQTHTFRPHEKAVEWHRENIFSKGAKYE